MAKSGKCSFNDSVNDYARLRKEIAARRFAPVYLLMGEEPYFIDALTNLLAESILSEAERAFGQTVVYGLESSARSVIDLCRQMPMMGSYQVVIVREAQRLRDLADLSHYTQAPVATTILVLCYKGKTMDRRLQLYKQISTQGVIFESVQPYEEDLKRWIPGYLQSRGFALELDAIEMLVEKLDDITKITNELDKLLLSLPQGTKTITAEQIATHIGISKDFNNFELTKALSYRDVVKVMRIADYFERNPKNNPLVLTLGTLSTHFLRIFIVGYLKWQSQHGRGPMPSDGELAQRLKVNPFFLKEYKQAAEKYTTRQVFQILGLLREYDLRSKLGRTTTDGELLQELLLKILNL